MAKPIRYVDDNEQKKGIETFKMNRQGMTEEGLHHKGAVSQFWCVIYSIVVRFSFGSDYE